jgi:hypothetical protein
MKIILNKKNHLYFSTHTLVDEQFSKCKFISFLVPFNCSMHIGHINVPFSVSLTRMHNLPFNKLLNQVKKSKII